MCIACREKNRQDSMLRLQYIDNRIISYRGYGRSFYICINCSGNSKKIKGLTKRFKQDEELFVKFLKEQK
jgi:predicted RNA-binding protein YlxR (DUF448 family)